MIDSGKQHVRPGNSDPKGWRASSSTYGPGLPLPVAGSDIPYNRGWPPAINVQKRLFTRQRSLRRILRTGKKRDVHWTIPRPRWANPVPLPPVDNWEQQDRVKAGTHFYNDLANTEGRSSARVVPRGFIQLAYWTHVLILASISAGGFKVLLCAPGSYTLTAGLWILPLWYLWDNFLKK